MISITRDNQKRIYKVVSVLGASLFWLALWAFLAFKVNESWILPSPIEVGRAFFYIAREQKMMLHLLHTLTGIMTGYLIGILLGVLLAVLTSGFSFFHTLFSPLLTVIKATPIASFILILWVFFVPVQVPILCVSLIVLPIVWANTEEGLLANDRKLREVCSVYHFSKFKKLKYLILPAVFPYFKTASVTALGMAWKAGVAAEVLCTPENSVGQMIYYSKRDIETAELLAWTALVVCTCFILEKLLGLLWKLPYRKKKKGAVPK